MLLCNRPDFDVVIHKLDVLRQRETVHAELIAMGHETVFAECTLDLNSLRQLLKESNPDVVFNLVESLGGTDRLITVVPWLLDSMDVPYTGASSDSILSTTNKVRAKMLLRTAGLMTPDWVSLDSNLAIYGKSNQPGLNQQYSEPQNDNRWILKPVWEHASAGMDDSAVVGLPFGEGPLKLLAARQGIAAHELFAERYIDGREFNVAIAFGEVLPPAEIDFSSFPEGKPRVVGHRAKWDENSFEYSNTPRRFQFPPQDVFLLNQLVSLSQTCWSLFNLKGLARVDFRVDSHGQPWILEINVNPCLSPDAGLAAALRYADHTFTSVIDQLISDALFRKRVKGPQSEVCQPPLSHHKQASSFKKPRFRYQILSGDRQNVGELVQSTGFFTEEEIAVAIELIDTRIEKDHASGYHFVFAEINGPQGEAQMLGYACFGPIACTVASWDLYWIAVQPALQSQGIGRALMAEVQRLTTEMGGKRLYIDTSGRPQYANTRKFYERCGFTVAAVLEDFYDRQDAKVVWQKELFEL